MDKLSKEQLELEIKQLNEIKSECVNIISDTISLKKQLDRYPNHIYECDRVIKINEDKIISLDDQLELYQTIYSQRLKSEVKTKEDQLQFVELVDGISESEFRDNLNKALKLYSATHHCAGIHYYQMKINNLGIPLKAVLLFEPNSFKQKGNT